MAGISTKPGLATMRRTLAILLALVVFLPALPAAARDIRLGGERSTDQSDKKKPKVDPNIVPLPPIVVAIRRDDGGWHHVQIDAWLALRDEKTAKSMTGLRSLIVRTAAEDIPKADFEVLQAAHSGSTAAKDVIRTAADRSLGRPWTGEVLIRSLVVY